jgi:ribosome-associated toxin RatA of RatAB toxin-antitoxin module
VATAWHVLTDYERYVDFIPDLRVSRVVARSGSTVTVTQSGDAVWGFKWPLDITFEIVETPPDRLQSRAVAGSVRSLVSHYALTPEASGTRLDYEGDIDAGFPLFARMEESVIERNVTRQFKAIVEEIERQAVHRVTPPTDGSR